MLGVPPLYLNLEPPMGLKQCRYGPMLYLTTDQYIGQALHTYGEFSEAEVYFFRKYIKENWTVLDVGANHGTHTVALAQMVGAWGTVHAFEPQRVLHQILCANLALNALSNTQTYQVALGREPGAIGVPRVDYNRPNNFGAIELGGSDDKVPVITLDSLNLNSLHFAKIDAEGAEGDIIAGGIETINRFKPLLYVENDREEKSAALIQQLFDLEYDVYWHMPYYYNRYNFFGVVDNIYGFTVSLNMFCVPKVSYCSLNSKTAIIPNDCFKIESPTDSWRNHT